MLLILFMLLCSCLAVQSADDVEKRLTQSKDEKKNVTVQQKLLKHKDKAPEGYTYVTTAKICDNQYLLVYGKHGKLKMKKITDKGACKVSLACSRCYFGQDGFFSGCAVLNKGLDGFQKTKKKFMYCDKRIVGESRAVLTDEKWEEGHLCFRSAEIPKEDFLELLH